MKTFSEWLQKEGIFTSVFRKTDVPRKPKPPEQTRPVSFDTTHGNSLGLYLQNQSREAQDFVQGLARMAKELEERFTMIRKIPNLANDRVENIERQIRDAHSSLNRARIFLNVE